jgi:predicted transposase/invertase (TIGR01784 family)
MPSFLPGVSKRAAVMDHDNGYKALFSHPEMVADLIRGFVHEDWVRDLDFSTLEKVEAHFVTRRLQRRESDVVWRLRWGGDRWLYVYLMLEFQSTVDPFMALRMMVYVGLLYQHLLRQRLISRKEKLPPVLPLVLYNGVGRWNAVRDIAKLIEQVPGGLKRYRPQMRYCLLDERRIATGKLKPLRNLAAALFRLEKSSGPEETKRVVDALVEWLQAPEQSELKSTFSAWVSQLMSRSPGSQIPVTTNLEEVQSMLAERVKEWPQEWKEEGRKEGREEERETALTQLRAVLIRELESRFGPLPPEARQCVESLDSYERISELMIAVVTAPSLAALGLC